ncbi:MAG: hypothetical protein R3C68_17540 [Myxococcota bacterium]
MASTLHTARPVVTDLQERQLAQIIKRAVDRASQIDHPVLLRVHTRLTQRGVRSISADVWQYLDAFDKTEAPYFA